MMKKIKIDLHTEYDHHRIIYAYANTPEEIKTALDETRKYIDIFLENDGWVDSIPENYSWCRNDEDFYYETLVCKFNGDDEYFNDELSYYY